MASERAEFTVSLNAGQAEAELAKLRQGANTLGGGLSNVSTGISTLEDRTKRLHRSFTPAAAAAVGLSSAFDGASSSAGKFATAGTQILGAFAAGGGVAAALAAGVFIIGEVSKAYSEAEANAKIFDEALRAISDGIARQHKVQMDALKASVQSLSTELRNFGKDSRQIIIDDLEFQKEAIDKRAATNAAVLAKNKDILAEKERDSMGFLGIKSVREGLEQQRALIKSIEQRSQNVAEEQKAAQAALDDATRTALELDAKEAERDRNKPKAGAAAAAGADPFQAMLTAEMKRQKLLDDINKKIAAQHMQVTQAVNQQDLDAAAAAALKEAALDDERAQKHKEMLQKMASDERTYFDKIGGYYTDFVKSGIEGAVSGGVSALGTYFTALAAHHKHAAEEAEAAFLSSVGNQLVGIGTKALFEGGEVLLTSHGLDPAGYGLLGLGSAAIAAGLGMGAGAAAINASIAPSSTSTAATHSGVNSGGSRGSGGTGGNQGVTVNIVYGAAGPAPQDTGREVNKALQAYLRSSGARLAGPQGPSR